VAGEIQRYLHYGTLHKSKCLSAREVTTEIVTYHDHRADKKAALEAQDLEHIGALADSDREWLADKKAALRVQAEEHTATKVQLQAAWDEINHLKAELAAQNEEHEKKRWLDEKLHKEDIADLETKHAAELATMDDRLVDATERAADLSRQHARELSAESTANANLLERTHVEYEKELAALRGAGEPAERLEYIARDLARLLLVSAREDIMEFRMNRSTYAWLVERANA